MSYIRKLEYTCRRMKLGWAWWHLPEVQALRRVYQDHQSQRAATQEEPVSKREKEKEEVEEWEEH